MGGVVHSVTHAIGKVGTTVAHTLGLHGHGGQTETGSETTTNQASSYLSQIPGYTDLIGEAVKNAGNVPEYQYAGLNEAQQSAINQMLSGTSPAAQAQKTFGEVGQQLTQQGLGTAQGALQSLQGIQGMTSDDYNKLISSYTNSDLVNQQKALAQRDINEELAGQLQTINQNASQTGNMGSSRAGVASGVAAGKASQAWQNALTTINQNAYQNAQNMAQYQMNQRQAVSGGLLTTGLSTANMGMNYQNTGANWGVQNINNQYQAGSLLQANSQNMMDIARQNQMLRENPALFKASLLNQQLSPLAGTFIGSSSSVTSQPNTAGMGGLFGGLGAMMGGGIGSLFGNAGLGTSMGGSLGSLAALFAL